MKTLFTLIVVSLLNSSMLFAQSGAKINFSKPEEVLKKYLELWISNEPLIPILSEKDLPYYSPGKEIDKMMAAWLKKHSKDKIEIHSSMKDRITYSIISTRPDYMVVLEQAYKIVSVNFHEINSKFPIETDLGKNMDLKSQAAQKKVLELYESTTPPLITTEPFEVVLVLENGKWKVLKNLLGIKQQEEKAKEEARKIKLEVIKGLVIESKSAIMEGYRDAVELIINNTTTKTITYAEYTVKFYDKDGINLGEVQSTSRDKLYGNEKAKVTLRGVYYSLNIPTGTVRYDVRIESIEIEDQK